MKNNRKVKIILMLSLMIISMQTIFALNTYVGVKILNLTDRTDLGAPYNCINESGTNANGGVYDYGTQGRIRGFSSIVGVDKEVEYPIFFNLTYKNNGTEIWSGNSTDDTDYGVGDIIQIPQLVDLTIGEDYNFAFDVDVYKIYLDLESDGKFEAKVDDIYWTSGYVGINAYKEYDQISSGCGYLSTEYAYNQYNLVSISNQRNISMDAPCLKDIVAINCQNSGYGLIYYASYYGNIFVLNGGYRELYKDNIGLFEIPFTFQ